MQFEFIDVMDVTYLDSSSTEPLSSVGNGTTNTSPSPSTTSIIKANANSSVDTYIATFMSTTTEEVISTEPTSTAVLIPATVGAFFGGVLVTVIISILVGYLLWKFKFKQRFHTSSKQYGEEKPVMSESDLRDDRNRTVMSLQSYEHVSLEINQDALKCYENLATPSKNKVTIESRQNSSLQSPDYQYQDPSVAVVMAKSRENSSGKDQYFILKETNISPESLADNPYFVLEKGKENGSESQTEATTDQYFVLEKTNDDDKQNQRVIPGLNADDGQYFVLEKKSSVMEDRRESHNKPCRDPTYKNFTDSPVAGIVTTESLADSQYFVLEKGEKDDYESQTEATTDTFLKKNNETSQEIESSIDEKQSSLMEDTRESHDTHRNKLYRDPTYKNFTDSLVSGIDIVTPDESLCNKDVPNQSNVNVGYSDRAREHAASSSILDQSKQNDQHTKGIKGPKRPKRRVPQTNETVSTPRQEEILRSGTGTYQNVVSDIMIDTKNETNDTPDVKQGHRSLPTSNEKDWLRAPTYTNVKADQFSKPTERPKPESVYSNISEVADMKNAFLEHDINRQVYENC